MAFLQALQALAVDSMLPALGHMAADLHLQDANQRQLVVGIFLIFGGLGCLVPGTLADRYGRRRVLMASLGFYIVCTIGCALVTNFWQLLAMRAILGFTCAGLAVLPAAIIRDWYEGDQMARLQSMVAMVFMVVPMIAPSIGQAVLLVASWRWIFGVMAVLAGLVAAWTWVRLPETLHPEYRQPIQFGPLMRTMGDVTANRAAFGYVFGMALIQGALFGYINSSQQLVAEHFGAGSRFPLVFACMASMMAMTNFVNARIVERFGARRVSHTALLVYICTSAVQLTLALYEAETLYRFIAVMTVNVCLMGFIGSNFASISLQPFARTAGAAASAQSFIRMVLASSLGALVGQAYDNSARPLAFAMVATGALALLLVLYSEHGKLFRRLIPPGAPRPRA
ncbi:multidrug effflux MFS transporter [Novosphingobium ovatum]|nr:multidrug effflux MFS transporter [Novosphingobium ovatum]